MLRKFVFGIFALEVVVMVVLLPFVIPLQNYSDQCAYIYSPRVFIGYWYVRRTQLRFLANDPDTGFRRFCSRHSCSVSPSLSFSITAWKT